MNESLKGLKALPLRFPRQCTSCGRIYHTEAEFLMQTQGVTGGRSSLKEGEDDSGKVIVEVFRNCVCGSTLMDEFHSRRDDSVEGQLRREQYSRRHGNNNS